MRHCLCDNLHYRHCCSQKPQLAVIHTNASVAGWYVLAVVSPSGNKHTCMGATACQADVVMQHPHPTATCDPHHPSPPTPHLVHARRQQLDDTKLPPAALQLLACGPVVKGAFHLHMLTPMAPCRSRGAGRRGAAASETRQWLIITAVLQQSRPSQFLVQALQPVQSAVCVCVCVYVHVC